MEGVIIGRHFAPFQPAQGILGTSSSTECRIGVKLDDGSEKIFYYYGQEAERVYLFSQDGMAISFKEGYKPFDTEKDI